MDDKTRETLREIGREIAEANFAVAFTGAGISTESGLPDYRGPGGLWKNKRFEELAHIETFKSEPGEFWGFYAQRLAALHNAKPNAAHLALEQLHEDGLIKRVITQNVDGLHRREIYGMNLAELHGSLRLGTCLGCGRDWYIAEVEERLAGSEDGVPHCDCGYPLKPGVTLFGENLPEHALEDAQRFASEADYLLCLGSSLSVIPAAFIPATVLDNGGLVGIINQGPTDYDDSYGVLKVEARLAEAMPIVAEAARQAGLPADLG